MRVTELLVEETARQYIKKMIADGFPKLLGQGYHASVFQSPAYGNMVVKVFNPKRDTRYFRYLKWCQAHQGNKLVPKIADVQTLTDDDGKQICLVFMKKLRTARKGELAKFAHGLEAMIVKKMKGIAPKAAKAMIAAVDTVEDWSPDDWAELAKAADDRDVREFAIFMSRSRSLIDLHKDNIMVDPDTNQLVIIDPLAS